MKHYLNRIVTGNKVDEGTSMREVAFSLENNPTYNVSGTIYATELYE